MADKSKSKAKLISELEELRQRSARPEVSEAERKHAEEALRSAHARLRATFDAIQENMNIVDLDFYLTDVNEVLIKNFGLSNRESVVGRKCFEVLKGRKDICPNCAVAEAYQSKAPVYRTSTPEDDVRTEGRSFEIFAYPIMDENGNISGAVEFAREITSRKQAENELRESEECFRAVLEAIPDLMIVLDSEGSYREIFTADSDLLYAPAEELRNNSIHDILPQEDAQQIQEIIDLVLATGELQYYEYQLETGGIKRWFAGRASRFNFQNADCVLWCARDITQRKKAEEKLYNSFSLLTSTIESTADGILVVDNQGKIVSFNQKFVEIWRIPDSIIASRDDSRALAFVLDQLEEPETFYAKVKELYSQPEAESYDILEFKDGKTLERYSRPQRKGKDIIGRVWSFRDVTVRKRAEEALRESEERHRMLLEASPDPIVVYDMEGKATYANLAFAETFGWSSQELLGKPIDFVPEESWPETRVAIARMLRGERIQSFETKRRTKDGTLLDIQLSSSVFHDREGNPAGNIVILRDVSDRKRAEEALRKREAELAAQSRHLEEVNAALTVLLKRREEDRADLEERVLANVKDLLLPYLKRLQKSRLKSNQITLVGILESNIKEIISTFATKLSSSVLGLTPTEIQVASLIREGKSTKEIAALLNTSENTVRSHRFHIRRKLGLINKKVNMRSYLKSLHDE